MSRFPTSAIAAAVIFLVGAAAVPTLFDTRTSNQGAARNGKSDDAVGKPVIDVSSSTPVAGPQSEQLTQTRAPASSGMTFGDAVLAAAERAEREAVSQSASANTSVKVRVRGADENAARSGDSTPSQQTNSDESAEEPADSVAQRGSGDEPVAEPQQPRQFDGRVFGRGHTFVVADLPRGPLKTGLESLPADLKGKALTTLNDMRFRPSEVTEGVIRVDSRGDVLFVDPAPVREEAIVIQDRGPTPMELGRAHLESKAAHDFFAPASAGGASGNDPLAGVPGGDVFKLHSRSNAPNTIYINFTGPLIENTVWNTSDWHEIGDDEMLPLDTVAYGIDDDPGTFSVEDKVSIFAIWRQVAEDFAPFNVNVTTEAPAVFTDNVAHAVVTYPADENGVQMPFYWAGGVAYGNHFGGSSHQFLSPALIYHIGSDSRTASTVSHEVGHQLSLEHWGTEELSYYSGHGAGVDSWAPIMGGGGSLHYSQWSRGEYPGSDLKSATVGDEIQDDIAEISARMGFAPDDHGDTLSTATPIIFENGGVANVTNVFEDPNNLSPDNKGVIEKESDVDIFGFDHTGGRVEFLATTMNEAGIGGSNVDLEIRLLGSNGAQIVGSNIEQLTFGNVKAWLPAGQYYVLVTGVANSDAPFPAYGSIGQYYLTGSVAYGASVDDVTPPAPNPGGWDMEPRPMNTTTLKMSAAKSFDVSGVEYFFECVTGPNCASSSWQQSRDYVISGLTPDEYYELRVKSRDASGNETGWSYTWGVWTWNPDACPNTVLSETEMWNFVPVIMENRCVTEGTICSSIWFSDVQTNTTAYCNNGSWQMTAPAYDPSTSFYSPTNTGLYSTDSSGNLTGPGGTNTGGGNTGGNNTGGLPLTDNCPNTVFTNGSMYDWEVNYGDNACATEGAVCDSTYFEVTASHQAGVCTGGQWVPQ